MPQFAPRVRASAAALGLDVSHHRWTPHPQPHPQPHPHPSASPSPLTLTLALTLTLTLTLPKVTIVEPVLKTVLNVSDSKTLDLFPPGVTDHLTFGEMAITLSHRKAWDACVDSELPACLIFEDDFTAVGPELRRRLDTAVALLPHDWQFLQLGRCWDVTCDASAARVSPDADLFRADQANMGTCFHAYAMTRKGAFELQKVAARLARTRTPTLTSPSSSPSSFPLTTDH